MSAALNFQTLYELDLNPSGTAAYSRLGEGITTATVANNESVDDKSYYNDEGGASSEVIGFQHAVSFSGDRIPGDPVQDFIFDKIFALGADRHTTLRKTDASGEVTSGDVTICNIAPPGGDANAVAAIGFDMKFNGKPTRTAAVAATALSMVVAAGSVVGTTKATATAGGTNHLAYKLSTAAQTAKDRQYMGSATNYTSAANIPAAAGQYLSVYELDAYNHVVKFACEILEAADIAST